MQNLSPDLGGVLLAAVAENNRTDLLLWSEPDPGRGVWQPAILVNDGEITCTDYLPGEAYGEARADSEHALLSEGHTILDLAMFRKLAEICDQKRGHVPR